MDRMAEGRAHEREIDMLFELTKQIEGHTICVCATPVLLQLLLTPFPSHCRLLVTLLHGLFKVFLSTSDLRWKPRSNNTEHSTVLFSSVAARSQRLLLKTSP